MPDVYEQTVYRWPAEKLRALQNDKSPKARLESWGADAGACGRFVRETGYRTVEAMCAVCGGEALRDIGPEVAERLADGLSDSWSHVRSHPPTPLPLRSAR